jgi:hypothetical protein
MTDRQPVHETLKELQAILANHINDRVLILGTMCCGKTTLLQQIPGGVDMDAALFSQLTQEEAAFICQTPWTVEIGNEVDRLAKEKLTIKPGHPHFGTCILDCEVIIYIDIDHSLLAEHCLRRGDDLNDALNLKDDIETDLTSFQEKHPDKVYYDLTYRDVV